MTWLHFLPGGLLEAFVLNISVLVIYCYIINHPKMGSVKQQSFILLTNLQSGQSQWGQLVSAPHGLPWVGGGVQRIGCDLTAGDWNHPKGLSLTGLLGPHLGLTGLSLWLLGFLTVWWLGSKGVRPQETR